MLSLKPERVRRLAARCLPGVNRTSPPTITVCARPRTFQPPNGVLRLLERNWSGSIVHGRSGVDDRHVGVGARPECSLGMPSSCAGLYVSLRMTSGQLR